MALTETATEDYSSKRETHVLGMVEGCCDDQGSGDEQVGKAGRPL